MYLDKYPASWVEIDDITPENNIFNYKKIITPTLMAPMIKYNTYVHR
jgi:hypothetical protein